MQNITSLFVCAGQRQSAELLRLCQSTRHMLGPEYLYNFGLELGDLGREQVKSGISALKREATKLISNNQKLMVIVGPTTELGNTCDILFNQLNSVHERHDIRMDELLRPRDFGIWQGQTDEQCEQQFPDEWPRFLEDEFAYQPIRGESGLMAAQRISGCMKHYEAELIDNIENPKDADENEIFGPVILYILSPRAMQVAANYAQHHAPQDVENLPKPLYAEMWKVQDGCLEVIFPGCETDRSKPLDQPFPVESQPASLGSEVQRRVCVRGRSAPEVAL